MRYGVKGVGTQLTIETGVGDNWEKLGLAAVRPRRHECLEIGSPS